MILKNFKNGMQTIQNNHKIKIFFKFVNIFNKKIKYNKIKKLNIIK